jgi:hypothetical protein
MHDHRRSARLQSASLPVGASPPFVGVRAVHPALATADRRAVARSGTNKYKHAVVDGLENNQVFSMCADPHGIPQFRTCGVVKWTVGNLLAALTYFSNERNGAFRIVERDEVADRFQIRLGSWHEERTHSLAAVIGHLGVFLFQTVKDLGGGLRFSAATTLLDFATQAVDHRLAALLTLLRGVAIRHE